MGLINFIRANLPESWDKCSTDAKMKTDLIKRIYANVPQIYKNKYHYKGGINCAKRLLKSSSILYAVDHTNINFKAYELLDLQIKSYEHLCG